MYGRFTETKVYYNLFYSFKKKAFYKRAFTKAANIKNIFYNV